MKRLFIKNLDDVISE